MKTTEEKLTLLEKAALDLDADMPIRVWVEGDGEMYGDFQGNNQRRIHISQFEAIKLIHKAAHAARRMLSV